MSRIRQPPLVTGISPNEGVPWTKVTIRGENLGTGPTDLIDLDQPSAVWVEEMDCSTIRMNRKKGISPLSISPSDPLGIKPEKGKVTQKELESLFPNMSGDFTNESFSATWYLIENHSAARYVFKLQMA
ncbi:EXOC2 protein, partial [Polypterus senegalus]